MTEDDIETTFYILNRTLTLSEEDTGRIIETIVQQKMTGTEEQINAAEKIKAECAGLSFLILNRWDHSKRIMNMLGMDIEDAKRKVLAIAGAIDDADWWIRNQQTVQLMRILQGKRQVEGFFPENLDAELKVFFRTEIA